MTAEIQRYEFGFNKKLVKSVPGPSVADNFRELVNMRHTDTHVQSVRGMTRMNSTALDGDILNGFNFVNEDSGENYILAHANLASNAGSAIYKSSSPEYGVHNSIDLSSASFLDEKGSITTFTVDTANTSGHFNAAITSRIKAGCSIVISGTGYVIISISGNGTSSNSVVFSGTLTTGNKTVSSIYGCAIDGSTVRLSRYYTLGVTNVCAGGTATASSTGGSDVAANACDNNNSTFWRSAALPGSIPAWWQYCLSSAKRVYQYNIYMGTYYAYSPHAWTFQGSNNGTTWTTLDTRSSQTWSAAGTKSYTIAEGSRGSYLYYRLYITSGGVEDGNYMWLYEFSMYEEIYVSPSVKLYPAIWSEDCTGWSSINVISNTETLNSQFIWYALSFDGGTSYSVFVSSAWLPVVRNNAGTWEYWTGSAWAASTINSALGAMVPAAGAAGTRMTGATMAGLSSGQFGASGGFSPGQTDFYIMAAMYSTSSAATPILSAVTVIVDTQAAGGDFDATPLHTCAAGAGVSIFSKAPSGAVAICNGEESLIYGGNEYIVGSFIGYDSTVYTDYTEQVRNRINDADNAALVPAVAAPTMYVGATRPVQGFKFYVRSANAVSATMAVTYWDGDSWEAVSNKVDNTLVSGKTLAVSGAVSFNDTQSVARPSVINGVMLYWYKIVFSAQLTAGTAIYHVTVNSPVQPIRDLWDGEPRNPGGFFKYTTGFLEYTGNVFENVYDSGDGGTYVNVGGLTSSQYIYAGFTEKIVGMSVSIYGGGGNTNASALTVSYWDGDSWAAVTGLVDGTKDSGGTKTHAQSGVIYWNPPATQFEKPLVKDAPLYYYRLSVDATLSATVHVFYVTGIPESKDISGYSFPMEANNRLWLLDEANGARNKAICSAADAPDVFNGKDSMEFVFGSTDPLIGGVPLFTQFGSNLYNMTVFWKRTEIWAVIGSNPEDWTQFRVSASTGCCAPLSICRATINAPGNPAQNQHVAFFQSEDGVYIFDGRTPMKISGDISNYFNQTSTEAIPVTMLSESYGFYDYRNDEYHLLIASGQDATALNAELVYDLRRNKWFEIRRPDGKKINTGFTVMDDAGFRAYYGSSGGVVYKLENGVTFDGDDIEWELKTGDISLADGSVFIETVIHGVRLVAGAHDNACVADVTLYTNGSKAGSELSSTFDLQDTDSDIVLAELPIRTGPRGVYHAIKLSGESCDAEGIDLYGLGFEYSVAR